MFDVKKSDPTRAGCADSKGSSLRRIGLIAFFAAISCAVFPTVSQAAAPSIINTGTGCSGQTAWLISCATAGQGANSGNQTRMSVLATDADEQAIASLVTDDDYDGTTDPTTVRAVTAQRPTIATGYPRTRANLTYTTPTSNTGMSCTLGTGTRRTSDRNVRIAARDTAGETSGNSSSIIKFVGSDGCSGPEDFAYLYGWGGSNFGNSITPGSSVTFTYNGDDPDSGGSEEFRGVRWRLRNLRTGAVGGTTVDCDNTADNTVKSTTVTFPDRGAFVVEAELLNNDGANCNLTENAGYWFPLGTADVNSSTIPAPTLSASRPQTNGNTTITLDPPTDPDSADGGGPQIIQWDLDFNTTNGQSGFETDSIAGEGAIFSTNQTKTINTTGLAPGTYTVRARVIDNGAMDAADSIRRTSGIATTTFTVNTAPVANNQTVNTTTNQAQPITLNGTDANGDTLTYAITDAPDNGTLTGSGASRTYTPNNGFAGTDSFTYSVSDGFGGTDTATVTINVRPETTIDSGPGNGDTTGPTVSFTFSSNATGATFECRIDGGTYSTCTSPQAYTLSTGSHTFDVRAVAGGQTDQTPASRTFTVDATAPETTIDSGPANGSTTNEDSVTFTFSSSEANSTFECQIDGGGFTSCTSPVTYSNLGPGTHTFEVRATDAVGNTDPTPASRTFTLTDAGIASSDGNTTTFQGEPGDNNAVTVTGGDPLPYVITDTGGGSVEAGPNCTQVSANVVSCPGDPNIVINLGDGNDSFNGSTAAGGNFTVNGGAGNDNLTGTNGDDSLNGGPDAGMDRLEGGGGSDSLAGGPGIDRALYTNSLTALNITIDDVANDSDGTGATTENVGSSVESITGGNGDDVLTGSCFANTLAGQVGNDTINGDPAGCAVGGGDFMGGGAGDDEMNGLDGSDSVTYTTNTAAQPISVTLDGNANDSDGNSGTDDIGNDVENVYGGAAADTIDATAAIQGVALYGRAGDDILTGSTFNDFLRGELGADTLDCGDGANDMFDNDPADTSVTNCETPG